MRKKNNPFRVLILVCIVIGVLSSLASVLDFDNDDLLDSIVTEGCLHLPTLFSIAGLVFLIRFFAAYITPPQLFLSPLVPPPISHN